MISPLKHLFILLTQTQLKHVGVVRPQHHGGYDEHRYPGENPLTASQASGESHLPPKHRVDLGSTNIPGTCLSVSDSPLYSCKLT